MSMTKRSQETFNPEEEFNLADDREYNLYLVELEGESDNRKGIGILEGFRKVKARGDDETIQRAYLTGWNRELLRGTVKTTEFAPVEFDLNELPF